MRILILTFISLLLLDCNIQQERKARFDFHELNLTAYIWNANPMDHKWTFYLAYYCTIDSNGECLIARKDTFKGQEKYFKNKLPENLDTLLYRINFNELQTEYLPSKDNPIIYDGFTYCMIINRNGYRKVVRFIPYSLNNVLLKEFFLQLEKFITIVDQTSISKFDYTKTVQYVRTQLADSSELPKYRGELRFTRPR